MGEQGVMDSSRRRRFLQTVAGVGTIGLAGCSLFSSEQPGENEEEPPEFSDSPTATPTPVPVPDDASFEFDYSDGSLTIRLTDGGPIPASNLVVRSSDGTQVRWHELGSTAVPASGSVTSGDTATIGSSVLNWPNTVEQSETIRVVFMTEAGSPTTLDTFEPSVEETPTDTETSTETPSGGTIEYSWEAGREGWEVSGTKYDDYVAKFNIIEDNPISGGYSAQTEALNNRIGVNDPDLPDQLSNESVATVTGKFRLDGDLNASEANHNAFVLKDKDGELAGRIVFYHGNTEIRWNTGNNPAQNDSPQVLQSFSEGEIYNLVIEVDENSFTVIINGNEYTDLSTSSGIAEVGQVHIDSRNSTGYGSSLYDSPIYFTWDDINIQLE